MRPVVLVIPLAFLKPELVKHLDKNLTNLKMASEWTQVTSYKKLTRFS